MPSYGVAPVLRRQIHGISPKYLLGKENNHSGITSPANPMRRKALAFGSARAIEVSKFQTDNPEWPGFNSPSQPVLSKVATFVLEMQWGVVPADVQDRAQLTLADTVGCMLHGSSSTAAKQAFSMASMWSGPATERGNATPLGFDMAVPMPYTAFVNGVAADAFDHNEGFYEPNNHGGHVAACIAPAVFAVVGANTGEDLMCSFLAGYEVASLASRLFHRRQFDTYHSSGAWAAIGAAAAAGRLLGLSHPEMVAAMQIAGWYGPYGLMMNSIAEPSPLKDSTAGGAKVGVEAAFLAKSGWSGCPNCLCDADSQQLEALGKEWFVMKNVFKRHPCCFWASAAVEAARQIRSQLPMQDASSIASVIVRTFRQGVSLSLKTLPTSDEEAQYNLQVPVALALLGRAEPSLAPMQESSWADGAVKALAAKVTGEISPEYDQQYPQKFLAQIEVLLGDGRKLCSESQNIPEPATAELEGKLFAGAGASRRDGAAILKALKGLPTASSCSLLQAALAPAPLERGLVLQG